MPKCVNVDRPSACVALWNAGGSQITVENPHESRRNPQQWCVGRQPVGRSATEGNRSGKPTSRFPTFGDLRLAVPHPESTSWIDWRGRWALRGPTYFPQHRLRMRCPFFVNKPGCLRRFCQPRIGKRC